MSDTRIQPFFRANNPNVGFFDGIRVLLEQSLREIKLSINTIFTFV